MVIMEVEEPEAMVIMEVEEPDGHGYNGGRGT